MDLDPGGEHEGEGGLGGNEMINDADERKGEEGRVVLRLLFLEGDEGALAFSSPVFRQCQKGSDPE